MPQLSCMPNSVLASVLARFDGRFVRKMTGTIEDVEYKYSASKTLHVCAYRLHVLHFHLFHRICIRRFIDKLHRLHLFVVEPAGSFPHSVAWSGFLLLSLLLISPL